MKSTKYIILFLFITLQTFAGNADLTKVDIVNLNVNAGLASNEVTSILQDDLGFMWFGTTNGLCRYDGYQFKTYRSDYLSPSLFLSNHVLLMEKDRDGHLWIVTSKEVVIFNPTTGLSSPIPVDTHLLNKIKCLLITRKGEVLFGTTLGVFRYNRTTQQLELLEKSYVRSLYEDSRGIIWVGTWGSGFFTLDTHTMDIKQYDAICRDKSLNITGFVEDKAGRMWVATWDNGGLYCLEKPLDNQSQNYKIYPVSGKQGMLPSGVLYDLAYDKQNDEIWVATAKGLAIRKSGDKSDSFKIYDANMLGGNEIWTLYRDNKNIFWASVLGGGVSKMVRRDIAFVHHPFPISNGNKTVTALYEDSESLLWIGARLDVLLLYNRKTDQLYSYKEDEVLKGINKEGNAVQSFLKHQRTGSLWLGTRYDGIYVVKCDGTKPVSMKRLRDEYPNLRNINAMSQDKMGRVWIATDMGLFIGNTINDEKVNIQPVEKLNKAINDECVQTVLCDNEGIWIGTKSNGAFRLSIDGDLSEYNLNNAKLNYDNVLCFCQDSEKNIWVGTQGGGLSKYNKKTDAFEMLKMINMFSDNAVYSILEDKKNNLWLATGKGLVCMSLNKREYAMLYTQSEGIVNTQFMKEASLELRSSEIIFGGYNGIDCYLPNHRVIDSVLPRTAIVDISVMNVPLQELLDEDELKNVLLPPYTKALTLAHNQNNVMLSFSSLSYTNPQANRYAYRLNGVDKEWIYVDANKRYISYNNLNRGNYVFEVKSCNENSTWSQPVELELTILPPPWQTWWAYFIYALVISITVSVIFRVIKRRIELQNALKIEQIEHKKSEEVNQAKLRFFTNISHELFTPLSVMLCSIESLRQDEHTDVQTLNIMRLNLSRLQRLLQQVMEFRKVESGNLKLRVSNNNIVAFMRELCEENFYPLLQSKNISLNFQSEEESIMAYFDVDKLDKIIYNLLSNALKYNYQDGVVSVSVSQIWENDKRYFVLKVENTGDGIPEDKIPLLFKRFYEGDYRKFKTKGTGIGLSLTKDLVELHNGTITVQSVPYETTVFTVVIPAEKEAYQNEQRDTESEWNERDVLKHEIVQMPDEVPAERANLLLVEDDPDLLTVMKKVIGKSFDIVTATNGKEALELLRENEHIEIVITDYVMPVMNGIELCREIRADANLNHLPIIMLTAKAQSEYHLEGFDAGADAYITKPFELSVLMAQVKTLVANRKLLVQKFRQKEGLGVQELGLSTVDQEFLDKAISIVEKNMDDSEFTNEMFYQAMAMTQSTLYRKLKTLTDLSPNEFIRNIRIKKACMLLAKPSVRIADVAYEVGFSDPKYFSIIFKKEKGMSPTEYIDSLSK